MLGEQSAIKEELARHFQGIYNQVQSLNLPQLLKVLNIFPNFFSVEEGLKVGEEVSKEEVKTTLSQFAKDKSPRPDGWPAKFFLHLFDLLGDEITLLINETCRLGSIPASLNCTFLVLIPKN